VSRGRKRGRRKRSSGRWKVLRRRGNGGRECRGRRGRGDEEGGVDVSQAVCVRSDHPVMGDREGSEDFGIVDTAADRHAAVGFG
jgi:hypothetical protein